MRGSKKFVRGGPTLFWGEGGCFTLVDEGRKDPNNITISGPSSARQRNAI